MQAAVDRERARIAREMHDVLGHQLSLIVAQASTTRRVFADRPEATAEALGSIEAVGRDALSGLRRVVGLLRADRGRPPGVDGLDALVGQLGRAGLPAQLVVHGTQRPLAAEVELTAFRIVQEALTNSLRHSGRSGVTITLTYGENALDIDVTERGPARAPDAGPTPARGPGPPSTFRVRAGRDAPAGRVARRRPGRRPRRGRRLPGAGPAAAGRRSRGEGIRHDDPGDSSPTISR